MSVITVGDKTVGGLSIIAVSGLSIITVGDDNNNSGIITIVDNNSGSLLLGDYNSGIITVGGLSIIVDHYCWKTVYVKL